MNRHACKTQKGDTPVYEEAVVHVKCADTCRHLVA